MNPTTGGGRGVAMREVLLLAAVATGMLLLFVQRALNFDDPLFVWQAQHLLHAPFDPFGFRVNWYEVPQPMYEVTQNPPLVSYYLAGVGALFGFGEVAMHLALLPSTLAAVLGTYVLARRFTGEALGAALAAFFTPAFFVSATGLMADVPLLACWVWALYAWLRGLDAPCRRWRWFLLSAVLVSAASFTKYFGVSLVPLLLAATLLAPPGRWRYAVVLLLPVALLVAWDVWTAARYGPGHFSAAFGYVEGVDTAFDRAWLRNGALSIVFSGACMASVLFFLPLLWSPGGAVFWSLLFVGGMLLSRSLAAALGIVPGPELVYEPLVLLQIGFWLIAGVHLLALLADDLWSEHDRYRWVLAAWVVGTLAFVVGVNHLINARVLLPLAPVAGILLVRRYHRYSQSRHLYARPLPLLPLLPAMLIALLCAFADYRLAAVQREVAAHLGAPVAGETRWFTGHWGFQYYMQQAGGRLLDPTGPPPAPGDVFVMPLNNANLFTLPPEWFGQQDAIAIPTAPLVTIMDRRTGAGFYAHTFGPLPFVFGRVPPEHFEWALLENAPMPTGQRS